MTETCCATISPLETLRTKTQWTYHWRPLKLQHCGNFPIGYKTLRQDKQRSRAIWHTLKMSVEGEVARADEAGRGSGRKTIDSWPAVLTCTGRRGTVPTGTIGRHFGWWAKSWRGLRKISLNTAISRSHPIHSSLPWPFWAFLLLLEYLDRWNVYIE